MISNFALAVSFATTAYSILDALQIIWDGKVVKVETVSIPTQEKAIFNFHCISEFAAENIFVFPMNP